jgi:hypothetical protein
LQIVTQYTVTTRTSMKYDATQYEGGVNILDGHPVPFAATCQRRRKEDGQTEGVPAVDHLSEIDDWMKLHHPSQRVIRCEGAYFFYGDLPKAVDELWGGARRGKSPMGKLGHCLIG